MQDIADFYQLLIDCGLPVSYTHNQVTVTLRAGCHGQVPGTADLVFPPAKSAVPLDTAVRQGAKFLYSTVHCLFAILFGCCAAFSKQM